MRYKQRVPVCGAILINETWDKVSPRGDGRAGANANAGVAHAEVAPVGGVGGASASSLKGGNRRLLGGFQRVRSTSRRKNGNAR
jgi:hypothetical protein